MFAMVGGVPLQYPLYRTLILEPHLWANDPRPRVGRPNDPPDRDAVVRKYLERETATGWALVSVAHEPDGTVVLYLRSGCPSP